MKGYKATHNFKCRNQTYKVGKTYTADKLEMCKHGFHFCKDMEDVLGYYSFDEKFVLLEVEALGNIETHRDKSVTDKLKVLRVVPYEEYTFKDKIPKLEFDDKGNMISMTYLNGDKYTCEYDERGNIISTTYPNGYKWTYEYDERGNKISSMSSPLGNMYTYEYDDTGNMISKTYPDGEKWTYEYDERGNVISKTNPNGDKWTYEYDEKGNKISETDYNGYKYNYILPELTIVTEED